MITTLQINQQIMQRVNFQHKVADRVIAIVDCPNKLELIHYDISEDCDKIEFMFEGDDFYFVIDSLLVFTPDVYFTNVAGEPEQSEVYKSVSDLFDETRGESFLSIVRYIVKNRPNILEAYDEEGKPVHYSHINRLAS